ncbi:hypothetical protein MF133_17435 [Aeromonas caviae]|uniref:hypothetical protein n=1 Tax=Aeromonas caviae TaxID=648 RepID=UPI001EF0F2EF|nr:hypothetical protein [Aeromonas caviae]ULH01923.1 hypothetical protein MF133_17435 [Aeromonas caviae]
MEYDEDAARAKRAQLLADAALGPIGQMLPAKARGRLVDAFASVTPPEEPKVTIGLITISSLHDAPKASSRKPGNVILNWRKLLDIVPDVSLAGLGAATLPVAPQVAVVLAGLYIWNKVWRGAVEEFSDVEAVTILALWEHRNEKSKISEQEGFAKTNEVRARYALPPLTANQYASAVNRLVSLDCIELEDGIIWLREWVRKKYS